MMNNYEGNDDYDHYQSRNNYHERHSGYEWLQDKWMRYKMQKMIQHVMNEDRDHFSARPYSFDNKMDRFDMDKYKMTKLMKEFFGNEYSMDQYEMMEKFFRNKNDMDSFEMMKMMMKFNEKEKNMDKFEMMRVMEKM